MESAYLPSNRFVLSGVEKQKDKRCHQNKKLGIVYVMNGRPVSLFQFVVIVITPKKSCLQHRCMRDYCKGCKLFLSFQGWMVL